MVSTMGKDSILKSDTIENRKVYITRTYNFTAGHRLYNSQKGPEWNLEVFGKCSYPGGHGHNYTLSVTLCGVPDPETGWIVDLEAMDSLIETSIMEWIDHRNLNEILELQAGPVATTEVLIVEIWGRLVDQIPQLAFAPSLHLLKMSETAKNSFEYSGSQR